jgi:hypothetical protein
MNRMAVVVCAISSAVVGLLVWVATSLNPPSHADGPPVSLDHGLSEVPVPVERSPERAERTEAEGSRVAIALLSQSNAGLAATAAAPAITLQGAVRQVLQDFGTGSPGPSYFDSASAMASPIYNPTGRILTAEQIAELETLVRQLDTRRRDVMKEISVANRDALMRSLDAGRFESIEYVVARDSSDEASVTNAAHENQKRREELSARLGRRLGVRDRDWFCAVVQTHEPDQIARLNVVYYLKEQEPEAVAMRQKIRMVDDEVDAALKGWFARK